MDRGLFHVQLSPLSLLSEKQVLSSGSEVFVQDYLWVGGKYNTSNAF